jgi:hypothetical protein
VAPQEFEELFLIGLPPMMLFLIRQVGLHRIDVRIANGKRAIPVLPVKIA